MNRMAIKHNDLSIEELKNTYKKLAADAEEKLKKLYLADHSHPYTKSIAKDYFNADWESIPSFVIPYSTIGQDNVRGQLSLLIILMDGFFWKYSSGINLDKEPAHNFSEYVIETCEELAKIDEKYPSDSSKHIEKFNELGVLDSAGKLSSGLKMLNSKNEEDLCKGLTLILLSASTFGYSNMIPSMLTSKKMSKASTKRWSELDATKSYAIELYKEGSWSSARQASRTLSQDIILYAESQKKESKNEKPFRFSSEDQAKDTIYKWFLEHLKK